MGLDRTLRSLGVAAMLLGCVGLGGARADVQELARLRQEVRRLLEQRASLAAQRDSVVAAAALLSARIDSLKDAGQGAAPGQLQAALRASIGLVHGMGELDRWLDTVRVREEAARERLRLAYDWEIARLIQRLEQQPDQGLLVQLMLYQQEREGLGVEPVQSELRYGAEMAISPTDGPDEIRQKMDWMESIAARLRAEAEQTRVRLASLEERQRLRTRSQAFVRELSLFDEHVAAGRVLVPGRALAGTAAGVAYGETGEVRHGTDGGQPATGAAAERALVLGAPQPARDAGAPGLGLDAGDPLVLEIRKLRARQQELGQLEALARERAANFRLCLDKMLEGGD